MAVSQKLGRSGAGQENYDTETGQYVETLTYNDKKEKQQQPQDPSRFVQNEPKTEVEKPVFNNLTVLNEEEKKPQEEPYNYAKAIEDQARLNNPNYFDEHGTPKDYNEEPTEKQMAILKKASADFRIPMDSMLEAFKNYSLNRDVYGRSAFMKMIKRQYAEREARVKQEVVQKLSPAYSKAVSTIRNNGVNIIKELNSKYIDLKNASLKERDVLENYKKSLASSLNALPKAREMVKKVGDTKSKKELARLESSIQIAKVMISRKEKEYLKKAIPNVKTISDINRMFNDDPITMLKVLESIAETSYQTKEQNDASKLLGVNVK